MNWSIDDLNKWQGLIGAAIGPFLAVIFSIIGFLAKSWIDKNAEKKESLRKIEVSVTASLNDIYNLREQLKYLVGSIRKLAKDVRSITDPKHFSLDSTNFPAFLEIYRDPEIYKLKVRSYYIHNSVMFADAAVKGINKVTSSLRADFEALTRKNELLIGLMQEHPNPPLQRRGYAENLELFALGIEKYATKGLLKPIELLTQLKIYNNRLRKGRGRGYWTWWRVEKRLPRDLDSLNKINAIIKDEVEKSLKDAESALQKTPNE